MSDATSRIDLHAWLGSTLSAASHDFSIEQIATRASLSAPPTPEIKSYPDAVYLNYYTLGISCMFIPIDGYTPPKSAQALEELESERLRLESVDMYNPPEQQGKKKGPDYAAFVGLPYTFVPRSGSPPRPPFAITRTTLGKDFVLALGEPQRKGGGGGPKAGNIGIWCEWSEEGLMVEFEGGEAGFVKEWEQGGEKKWRVLTIFERGKQVR